MPPSEGRTRILVVEDESIVALDMRNRLSNMGFEVVGVCDTADKAVEYAESKSPECILMDINLKGEKDGVQAAESIQRTLDIPIIYVTAFADKTTLARAKVTQAFGYILKPFQEREVLIAIEMALYKHQVERDLRENREWLNGSLQAIADAVIALDTEERVVFMNKSAEALLGVSDDAARGAFLKDLCAWQPEATDGQAPTALVVRSAAGSRPVERIERPIVNRNTGAEAGKVLVVRDLSESLAAEQARSRLASIVANSYDAIMAIDGNLTVVSWNFGAERMYGYSAAEMVGHSLLELLPDETDRAALKALASLVLSGREMGRIESRRRCRSGRILSISQALSPVRNSDGKVLELSCIERDISAEKEHEASLVTAKFMAEEANRAKSEFLSNMSHELRTPLNSIIGMIELTRDLANGDEQREYLGIARQSAGNLLLLINSILDFSKIEAGKMRINAMPMDLVSGAADCLEHLSVQANRKGLALLFRFDPAFPSPLVGDLYRLQQILTNLLSNAVKFTEKGRVRLDLDFSMNGDGKTAAVRMTVSDTGIGIPQNRMEDIWEQFTQLDASSTRAYGGTGLGLAIAKSLTELMGGTLVVESVLDEGSAFTVEVPLGVPPDSQRTVSVLDALTGCVVGIVVESAEEREILAELIGAWGCTPMVLENAESVIALLRGPVEALPRLVLIDDLLPDRNLLYACVDDFECLNALRERLVVLAGVGGRDEPGWRGLSDSVRFLIKPLRREALLKILSESTSGVRGGTPEKAARPRVAAGPRIPLAPLPDSVEPIPFHDEAQRAILENFLKEGEPFGLYGTHKMENLILKFRRTADEAGAKEFSKVLFKLLLACRRNDEGSIHRIFETLRASAEKLTRGGIRK